LEMDGVSFQYPDAPEPLLDGFDLKLVGPERVAVNGGNGSGKTTLLQIISGELEPQIGRIVRGVDHIAYVDQHARNLDKGETLVESFQRNNPSLPEGEIRQRLAHFLFFGDDVFKRVKSLSGGERMRAALACALVAE